MRVVVVLLLLLSHRMALAEPIERVDTIGAVSAMTWDGRPSAGVNMRLVLVNRLALAAQVRARSGELVENLDLVFQLTQGNLESTFDRGRYPIRLDLLCGVGAIERTRYATASFGAAMRIRISERLTLDVGVRDEVSRAPRPNRFVHVPEVQVGLSWTTKRFAVERSDDE